MAQTVRAALQRWEAPLLRYATSFVGPERARDVVQETFLRLWERRPTDAVSTSSGASRADEGLAPWLFTVCRNRVVDIARKEGRMQITTQKTSEEVVFRSLEGAGAAATPFDAMARDQDSGRLRAAVEMLPERQRELVRLRYQGGLSYKDIATTLNLSVSNVGFLLHGAIKSLRTTLGGEA
jgi:RNA polymerase sigma factor (sigma-70 family)